MPAPSRRHFGRQLALAAFLGFPKAIEAAAGRKLDFKIGQGFDGTGNADLTAVLTSAASEIWKHCPNTQWQVPGFFIFHSDTSPITVFDHTADGRIAIGLASQGMLWAQFAYQFSHEFCHALAGHANDWKETWIRGRKANHWLEESICEAASLFAMRAMAKTWAVAPPFPNWKGYAKSLGSYAADRSEAAAKEKTADFAFQKWFASDEASLRENATDRDKNNIVAAELLPIFEAEPAGWEAMVFFNRTGRRNATKSLADHFRDWSDAAPANQRPFIGKVAAVFGIAMG